MALELYSDFTIKTSFLLGQSSVNYCIIERGNQNPVKHLIQPLTFFAKRST